MRQGETIRIKGRCCVGGLLNGVWEWKEKEIDKEKKRKTEREYEKQR